MEKQNFVDYVKIMFRSGKGGAGAIHFHRDKKTAKGGPDGGDGGRGGHIILKGNNQLWTLLHLKYQKHTYAGDGKNGTGVLRTGKQGDDRIVEVPLGTIAKNAETGEVLAEIMHHDEEIILFPGGRGGMGNNHFKTSTKQTPRFAQPGESGQELWTILELKVLADVGLVGFPNAGKSTLLSKISAAKPEIADYPFTTIVPNLGIVSYRDNKSFIMADIPGIIEGASQGKGLGDRFLKHIERNSVLLFMIPVDSKDIHKEYKILLNELKQFNPELLLKDKVLAITKSDLADAELEKLLSKDLPKKIPHIFISSHTEKNLLELKDLLWKALQGSDLLVPIL
ncbi:MAG: GTPase ObgE [Bacteroidetes bacterium]|nr:GTPase ObgE [Bacteroidota bacterium]